MKIKTLCAGLLLVASIGQVQANLLQGQQVGFTYYLPDTSQAYSNHIATVGDGVEIANAAPLSTYFPIAQLDITDSNLLISFLPVPQELAFFFPSENAFTSAPFNGFLIYDVDGLIDAFTSVTINAISNLEGIDEPGRITFDDDHIWINWQGLSYDQNRTVLSIDINHDDQSVPEPGTLALIGLGIIMMTRLHRNKL